MNCGTLDRLIQIQRQAAGLPMVTADGTYLTTSDGTVLTTSSRKGRFGAELDAWGLLAQAWARKMSARGNERTANGREVGQQTVVFRIRYRSTLSILDRIVYDGHAYDIDDVNEIEPLEALPVPLGVYGRIEPLRQRDVLIQDATIWTAGEAGVIEAGAVVAAAVAVAAAHAVPVAAVAAATADDACVAVPSGRSRGRGGGV